MSAAEPDDRISVDTGGSGNAVAAGRGARAWVVNISGKWWVAALLLVVFIAALGLIYWRLTPKKPKTMGGLFNVAVASFQVQDTAGKSQGGKDGYQLADFIARQVDTNFKEMGLEKVVPFSVWGPDLTDEVKGSTSAERETNAKALAEKIKATVLIYGVIHSNDGQSRFEPRFYVNHQAIHEADEITGDSQLGAPLKIALPFADSIAPIENPALAGRTNALDMITIGLAYYSVDDFDNSLIFFQKAADDKRWLESAGKEVVYLLMGNANVRQASKKKDPQYLPAAEKDYAESLRINDSYGRGLVGQANVLYLQALGDPTGNKIDPTKFDEMEKLLEQALALTDQPASANLEAKARYLRGQVDLARMQSRVPGGDWAAKAKEEFQWIVSHYTAGDKTLATLASHAYVRLGTLAALQGDMTTAVDLIQKGIALSSPFYQGDYTAWLGDLYASSGQKDKAIQAYQDAISIAESNSDADSAHRYSDKLKKVNSK